MFDLARWAKQDIAGHKSTEEGLSDDRLKWYRARSNKLMDAVQSAYPDAVKTWRATTLPEDQAQELDYFNVSSGFIRSSSVAYADVTLCCVLFASQSTGPLRTLTFDDNTTFPP
jgi:hypothetical protein